MLKNKLSISIIAGAMALVGGIGGTALMASAQTATNTNTPSAVIGSSNTASTAVDTPESANDPADSQDAVDTADSGGKADTDNIQSGNQQVGEHQDADGGAASEASEPAGSSDTTEQ